MPFTYEEMELAHGDPIPTKKVQMRGRIGPDLDDIFRVVRAIGLVSVWALTVAWGIAGIYLMVTGSITIGLFCAFIALLFRPWVTGGDA